MTHRILRKPIETIPGLAEELAAKAGAVHSHDIEDVAGLADALEDLAPADHGHAIGDIDELAEELANKADAEHSHDIDDVTGLADALWDKAPAAHAHPMGDVYELENALAGKAATVHTHELDDVTGLADALDGKAAAVHTHEITDVTGLQTALNGKAASSHTHSIAEVTGLQTALDLKADLIGGVIPSSQLPALVKTDVKTVNSAAAMLALTAQTGDIAIRTDLSKTFVHNGGESGTAADWSELISPTDAVTAVNGLIGNITLGYGDVGAASAIHYHEIADVSGLQTALDGKAASSHTHTISDLTDLPVIAKSSTGNAIVQANATGTINDSFLPTYLAKTNSANTFTKAQTITAGSDIPANVIDGLQFSILNAFPGGGSAGQYKDAIFGLGVSVPHVQLCGGGLFSNNQRGHFSVNIRTDGGVFNERLFLNHLGQLGLGTNSPAAKAHFVSGSASMIATILQGAASQSANLQEFWNSAGTTLSAFSSAGSFLAPPGSAAGPSMSFLLDPNTGIYSSIADTLEFSTAGVRRAALSSQGLTVDAGPTGSNGVINAKHSGGASITIENTGTGGGLWRWVATNDSYSVGGQKLYLIQDVISTSQPIMMIASGRFGFGQGMLNPKATIHGIGSTILGAATSAVADSDMGNGQINLYLDESGHNLKVKAKYSNGTIRTATIALVA